MVAAHSRSVLTIAGSDSSGGAGIQADLKTFAALGVYGTTAVTAVTAQNSAGVTAVQEVSAHVIAAQIDAVVAEFRPDAVKTGMLANAEIVEMVARKIEQYSLPNLVVDPVIVSTSGVRLLTDEGVRALRELLLPLAHIVAPNIPEAEALSGISVCTLDAAREAVRRIQAMGPACAVITGGHREGDTVTDVFYDGSQVQETAGPRVPGGDLHGTGCTFSSAVAAFLALGHEPLDAVRRAHDFVAGALRCALPMGNGKRTLNHSWQEGQIDGR